MQKEPAVPTLPTRNALHILRHRRHTIQRLPPLHLVRHLPHVHLNLPPVLRHAVETHERPLVEEQEACCYGYSAGETHDRGEAGFADFRRGDALPPEHERGWERSEPGAVEVVAWSGIAKDAAEVGVGVDEGVVSV